MTIFRAASSLNEVLLAQLIAETIATKTGRDHLEIFHENCEIAGGVLQRSVDVVREISRKLLQTRKLSRAKLAPLLARVVP